MESLALAASLVVVSSIAVGLGAIAASLLRLRTASFALGIASTLIGVWWLFTLPGVPLIGAFTAVAGYWAIVRTPR